MSEENSLAKSNGAIELRPRKLKALQGLKDDLGVVKAAKFAGISRTTLYRWLTSDPVFIAALNDWKSRKLAHVDAILIAGAPTAARRLVRAARHDSKAATVLLKGVGAFSGKPVGSADPHEVQQELAVAEEERRINREAKKQKLLDQQLKVFARKRAREQQIALLPAPAAKAPEVPPAEEKKSAPQDVEERESAKPAPVDAAAPPSAPQPPMPTPESAQLPDADFDEDEDE